MGWVGELQRERRGPSCMPREFMTRWYAFMKEPARQAAQPPPYAQESPHPYPTPARPTHAPKSTHHTHEDGTVIYLG